MNTLTKEDYQNILVLLGKTQISGSEALPVAILIQKINNIITPPKDETGTEKK